VRWPGGSAAAFLTSVTVVWLLGALGPLPSAGAACDSAQDLGGCTFAGVGGLFGPAPCPPGSGGEPAASASAVRLERLIEQIPCPSSGRVSFATVDDLGEPMGVLDVVADPAGGYLGVYHTAFGQSDNALDYRICLGHSSDLIHWHRLQVLDPAGASMPTLRAVPGQPGYLLAYEKSPSTQAGHVIRVRYYATQADLLAGRYTLQRDLPRRLSAYNNGTPTLLSVHWPRSIRRSVLRIGFHYETSLHGRPGPDREAVGTLRGLRSWSVRADFGVDALLDSQGLHGNHGDWREFSFDAARWRLYEAQRSFDDFSSWRVVLNGPGADMYPVTLKSGNAVVSSSFGNPVATELPAPTGSGQILLVTVFVFASPAPGQTGELIYYQPL